MNYTFNPIVLEALFLDMSHLDIRPFYYKDLSSVARIQLLDRILDSSIPRDAFISTQLPDRLKMEAMYLLNFRRPLSQSCFNRFVHSYFSLTEMRINDTVFSLSTSANTKTLAREWLLWF